MDRWASRCWRSNPTGGVGDGYTTLSGLTVERVLEVLAPITFTACRNAAEVLIQTGVYDPQGAAAQAMGLSGVSARTPEQQVLGLCYRPLIDLPTFYGWVDGVTERANRNGEETMAYACSHDLHRAALGLPPETSRRRVLTGERRRRALSGL